MKRFCTTILCVFFFFQSYSQQLLKEVYGTNASTLDVANAVNIGGAVYFTASNVNQTLLYKTDGTPNGTVLLNMASTGDYIQSPTNLTNLNGSLIFLAYKGSSSYSLFKTNGSISGTVELLNTTSDVSFMNVLGVMSNVLYFSFLQDSTGVELWRTDGTPAGTYMVKNINAGSAGSNPASFNVLGTKAYFQANNGVNGAELWRTNGTASGTVLVKDIYTGASGSYPSKFAIIDTTLFFQATNAANGSELWKSNGAGTVLVKDIHIGAVGSTPSAMQVLNNQLYFTAYDSLTTRLWKSNGTAAGTQLVKDSLRNVINPVVFNNQLFFAASNGVKGVELWKSNGTAAGTALLKDIHLSSGAYDDLTFGSNPAFTVAGTTLYFFANDNINGRELWKTNGTLAGTALVKNIADSTKSTYFETGSLFAIGNKIAFMAASAPDEAHEMWISDGTSAGTLRVKNVNPGLAVEQARVVPVVLGTGVFFTAYHPALGYELYRTDGTLVNTLLVKDLNTETVNSSMNPFGRIVHLKNTTFFMADDGKFGNELWATDSARVNTTLYRDFTKTIAESIAQPTGATRFSTYFNNFTVYKNNLYRMVNGRSLWKTDSANATVKVFDTFSPTTQKVLFATLNNELYFLSDGLYKSDSSGFHKVTHKIAGTPARSYSDADSSVKMIAYNGFLYFTARGYDNKGDELWRTNGTDSSTTLVKDINPGASGSSPYGFVVYHNKLYFIAATDSLGHELWQSDGTAAGTKLVKDIYVGAAGGLGREPFFEESYGALVVYKDKLYFRATDLTHGTELWQSDGTNAGTILARDIVVGTGSSTPFSLVPFNNKLYFIANHQLWRIDSTAAGAQLVKNTLFSDYRITKSDSALFLTAYETSLVPMTRQKGYELYRSDGAGSGTLSLTDIGYAVNGSSPQLISEHKGRVFFSAYRSDIGREVWSMRPNCRPEYFFENPWETTAVGANHYFKAANKIEAINTLQSGSSAIYQAGNKVELKPGFEVKAGAVFKAQINGCATD